MIDEVGRVQSLIGAEPDVVVPIPRTDRVIAADVEGAAAGTPVVLIHGTPDSRLARHPDPSIAQAHRVRLIAVDRPGFGRSTLDPLASPTSFAHDLEALLDHLDVAAANLIAWSAGATWALGAAATIPERTVSVTVVGGLVPFEAFTDPTVRAAAGEERMAMIETAADMGATNAAELLASLLVPDPPTPQAALEQRSEGEAGALDTIRGASARMAAACLDAVHQGPGGLQRDLTVQLTNSGIDFDRITRPISLLTGDRDTTCPAAFAHWYAGQIPNAKVRIVEGADHGLLVTHWDGILADIVRTFVSEPGR